MTKKDDKVTDELADTILSENKTSTNKVEKSTDEKAGTLFSEKKPLTKDVEKGTDELAFNKQKLNKIHRKGLNQFEVQSTGTQGWFKLDIEFLKTTFSKSHSEFYKLLFKNNIEDQDTEVYKKFLCRLINN